MNEDTTTDRIYYEKKVYTVNDKILLISTERTSMSGPSWY
jgi:hypothetical protein